MNKPKFKNGEIGIDFIWIDVDNPPADAIGWVAKQRVINYSQDYKNTTTQSQGWCYALDHFPEIIDDIGQAIGVDDEGDGFAEDDDGHVAFEGHIGQTCQHTDEVGRTNWPDHHEDKEAIEPLAFIEPANVLVVGLLTDHGLDELRPVHSSEMEDNGTANDNSDVVVDGPDDVAIDKDTSDRCQGARNNRDHCLKDLKKDKERWSKDSGLQNKS